MKDESPRALLRPCPLCGSGVGKLLGNLRFEVFDGSPVVGAFSMVACDECGFGFYDTPSTQADFDRYYEENVYYYTAESTGSGGSRPEELRRFDAAAQRLAPHLPGTEAVVFDIGCGKGGLLGVLAAHGYSRLYGVDMLPACVEHIRSKGFAAGLGSALNIPFPEVRADMLIYSHIIEHVTDLRSLLAVAGEKLNDGGVVFAEIPDASRYGEYSGLPFRDLYLEHVNHMDGESLTSLFRSGGFHLLESGRSLLETGTGDRVPCAWGIFRKGRGGERAPGVSRDLESRLEDYLSWSTNHSVLKKLGELADSRTPLTIWGVSQYAMLLLGQTALRRCALRGFVDRDSYKQTRSLMGRPILPPEALRGVGADGGVLVTAVGHERKIMDELREMGFRGAVYTLE